MPSTRTLLVALVVAGTVFAGVAAATPTQSHRTQTHPATTTVTVDDTAPAVDSAADVESALNESPHVGWTVTGTHRTVVRENGSVVSTRVRDRTVGYTSNHTYERAVVRRPASKASNVYVANATTEWRYNATTDRAIWADHPRPATDYARDFERHPNATYLGTETVANRSAHLVRFGDAESESASTFRVWYDAERFVPLKSVVVIPTDDGTTRVTNEYTNVSFDEGVDRDTFAYDPPADAAVYQRPTPERFADERALQRAAGNLSLPAPSPQLPRDFEFRGGMLLDGIDSDLVRYRYQRGNGSRVAVAIMTGDRNVTDGKDVTINGHAATLAEKPTGNVVVEWRRDGALYRVNAVDGTGVDFTRRDLLEVADSIDETDPGR